MDKSNLVNLQFGDVVAQAGHNGGQRLYSVVIDTEPGAVNAIVAGDCTESTAPDGAPVVTVNQLTSAIGTLGHPVIVVGRLTLEQVHNMYAQTAMGSMIPDLEKTLAESAAKPPTPYTPPRP